MILGQSGLLTGSQSAPIVTPDGYEKMHEGQKVNGLNLVELGVIVRSLFTLRVAKYAFENDLVSNSLRQYRFQKLIWLGS
jgi:hypothetical protein